MKKNVLAILLAVCMLTALLTGCGGAAAPSEGSAAQSASESAAAEASETVPEPVPEPEIQEISVQEASAEEPEEIPAEEPSAAEEPEEPAEPATCTATFSDGQTFEATVGEDFVFFFQCDAPGDMGAPEEGEEGAGITVSDGTVTYSNVGVGGPFKYPTSELVTVSEFSGDFTITITEAATNLGATYTIYTDPDDIEAAIAFQEEMAKAMAENPMP